MDSPAFSRDEAISKLRKGKIALPDRETLLKGILDGDRVLLSRAITLIESRLPEHRPQAAWLTDQCLQQKKPSFRIGITGVPGVGKSTFINQLAIELTQKKHKVAILAIDPSSSQTKGSILGDKTRMEDIFSHQDIFIRPSPAGETLGGVARATRESIFLCEAAGFDVIIIETVGVGQSETAVHSMTDLFLLLMLPGAGDELQGIKRGIMELADIVIVHKADGINIEKAKVAAAEYKRALHLFPPSAHQWIARVLQASSTENIGWENILQSIEAFELHVKLNGYLMENRRKQHLQWFRDAFKEKIFSFWASQPGFESQLLSVEKKVGEGLISPYHAAEQLLENLLAHKNA